MDKHLLRSALHEIESLRHQNEILSAQVGVVEVFATALGMRKNNGAMSEDVAWMLRREIEKPEGDGPTETAIP